MMKETVGKTAGAVWKLMQEKESINIAQLPRILKEKSVVVYQAVGWLARENKIEYKITGDKIFISLHPQERS